MTGLCITHCDSIATDMHNALRLQHTILLVLIMYHFLLLPNVTCTVAFPLDRQDILPGSDNDMSRAVTVEASVGGGQKAHVGGGWTYIGAFI